MNPPSAEVRFHSLDALRGWAMLLGIVLHAAWIMSANYSGTPITDVDGNYACDYLSYGIHMFRLQTFFVMAGFFAHLVLSRRGQLRFIWHRVSRIAIPFVVGSILLYPIMAAQSVAGGLISGRILSDQRFWVTAFEETVAMCKVNPGLTHLWFLYDLLVVYALALLVRAVFQHVLDRRGRLRAWIAGIFGWLMRSPWAILALAVPSSVLLYFEEAWWGLFGFPIWFIPSWPGLLGYWLFFSVGWLLYSQWHLLTELSKSWRSNLAVGVVLSIPLFVATIYSDLYGTIPYPMLAAPDILEVSGFQTAASTIQSSPSQRVRQSLSPRYQKFLTDRTEMTSDQKFGLAMELNTKIVGDPDFYDAEYWQGEDLPDDVVAMLAENATGDDKSQVGLLNRRLLELALPGSIATDASARVPMKLYKALFSAGYAVAMWCLVFGCIGAFNALFPNPSRMSRYIADSSYWVYLLHLPVMFQIELWVAGSRWGFGGIPKFLLYNVATAAVCLVSYHYLVRSTFIGRALNGRTYPFVPLFGKRPVPESVTNTGVPSPAYLSRTHSEPVTIDLEVNE